MEIRCTATKVFSVIAAGSATNVTISCIRLSYVATLENIAQLVDEGSFKEYGPLGVIRQHQRQTDEEFRKNTPAEIYS